MHDAIRYNTTLIMLGLSKGCKKIKLEKKVPFTNLAKLTITLLVHKTLHNKYLLWNL